MRAAATEADLANAIGTMLEELHDPATRVFAASSEPVSSELPLARRDRDVLIVNAGPYAGEPVA